MTTEESPLLPPRRQLHGYLVDLPGGRTLTAFTDDVDNNDYDDNRDVLSDMIESLDIR